MNDNALEK